MEITFSILITKHENTQIALRWCQWFLCLIFSISDAFHPECYVWLCGMGLLSALELVGTRGHTCIKVFPMHIIHHYALSLTYQIPFLFLSRLFGVCMRVKNRKFFVPHFMRLNIKWRINLMLWLYTLSPSLLIFFCLALLKLRTFASIH